MCYTTISLCIYLKTFLYDILKNMSTYLTKRTTDIMQLNIPSPGFPM